MLGFLKELLGTGDREWLAKQPIGFGLGPVIEVHATKWRGFHRRKWEPAKATLLAHRRGHFGGYIDVCISSKPGIQEIYQTHKGKFVFHFVSRESPSDLDITTRLMKPSDFYEYMTGRQGGPARTWEITPAGQEILAKFKTGLPNLR